MNNEQYKPEETLFNVPSQETSVRTEAIEQQNEEYTWFYYLSGGFKSEATDDLEKALARLQKEEKNIRRMDSAKIFFLLSALHNVKFELLIRKNPKFRKLADEAAAVGKGKYELQRAWEKEILAREGEEGLKQRNQNGEGPGRQYTREELDLYVSYAQAQVDAGILPPLALKQAIEEREAGGYYQWQKEFSRKNAENNIRELKAVNDPDISTVIQNIYRLTEENYGTDNAEKQKADLMELAGIASPKEPSTPPENTAG